MVNFADSTSLHGIPDAIRSETRWEKLFWILLLIGSFGYLGLEVRNIVLEYEFEPTSTQFELITPTGFPEMLYCPAAWLDPERVGHLGYDVSKVKLLLSYLMATTTSVAEVMMKFGGTAEENEAFFDNQTWTVDEIFGNLSYSPDDLLTLVKRTMTPEKTVYTAEGFMSHRGMCLKIFVGGTKIESMEASMVSFRVYVKSYPLNTTFHDSDVDFAFFGQDGVSIMPAGEVPINRNRRTTIKLRSTFMQNANVRRKPCVPEEIYEKADIPTCAMNFTRSVCPALGLRPLYVPGMAQFPNETSGYLQPKTGCLFLPDSRAKLEAHSHLCPRPCEKWIFESTVFFHEGIREDTEIEVSYMNPVSSLCVRESKSFSASSLVGAVGGTISLWSGASILTFAQLFVIVVKVFGRKRKKGHSITM